MVCGARQLINIASRRFFEGLMPSGWSYFMIY